MSDVIDQANHQAELIAAAEISARRQQGPRATGLCLNCGEPVEDGVRWCSVDCRDDWQCRNKQ